VGRRRLLDLEVLNEGAETGDHDGEGEERTTHDGEAPLQWV
jgi:hypothetical protein